MRRLRCIALLLLFSTQAYAYTYWNEIRHSALLPGDSVTVRVENIFGTGIENYLLYPGAGIKAEPMTALPDGPSTLEATVPGPVTDPFYYGFRLVYGEDIDLMPVRLPDGASPAPEDLTQLAPDAVGDELFGYTNLDLVDCHVSFSGDRLYASLENAGGGFPVIQGLTFFGYLLGIADPAIADPDTVLAIMYTFEQSGIISPGLYKITGTGLGNLIKLGEVTVQEYPESNTLLLSCLLGDLYSDPYFMSWYDAEDPVIGVAAFTQRITLLGGAAEADRSPGGRMYLRELSIAPGANQLPELAEPVFEGSGAAAFAGIDYADADGHCPVLAEVVFDGGIPYPMYPQSLDYTTTVVYRTDAGIDPLANGSWTNAVFRFSDNETDIVEHSVAATAVWDGSSGGACAVQTSISPNPFNATSHITYILGSSGKITIEIFDVSGRLIRRLRDETVGPGIGGAVWDGKDDRGRAVSSGTYFCRITALGGRTMHKMILIR